MMLGSALPRSSNDVQWLGPDRLTETDLNGSHPYLRDQSVASAFASNMVCFRFLFDWKTGCRAPHCAFGRLGRHSRRPGTEHEGHVTLSQLIAARPMVRTIPPTCSLYLLHGDANNMPAYGRTGKIHRRRTIMVDQGFLA